MILQHNEGYIITGTYCMNDCKSIGPNKITVPQYLFKILYLNSNGIMYSFLFDNTLESYNTRLKDHQVTVDDIERIIGEDFFEKLPDPIENKLESVLTPIN